MSPRGATWWITVVFLSVGATVAAAQELDLQARANLQPSVARLGDPVVYRGRVVLPRHLEAKWLPPETNSSFTWGELSPRRAQGPSPIEGGEQQDTLTIEATLQAFGTGVLPVVGPRFQVETPGGARVFQLPTITLTISSVLGAADSAADLRPVRGPIGAPWWERINWLWTSVSLVVALLLWIAYRRWRRGRVMVPVAPPAPAFDPAAEALAALAALRAKNLAAQGRHAEHAFQLTSILRRFLEATILAPFPGDTSRELLIHLETAGLPEDELQMLSGLLRLWDHVKFARAESDVAEAQRAEQAVERVIRRHAQRPLPVAATARKVA